MDFWKLGFQEGWASESELKEAVLFEDLTPEQYKQITGKDYEPA